MRGPWCAGELGSFHHRKAGSWGILPPCRDCPRTAAHMGSRSSQRRELWEGRVPARLDGHPQAWFGQAGDRVPGSGEPNSWHSHREHEGPEGSAQALAGPPGLPAGPVRGGSCLCGAGRATAPTGLRHACAPRPTPWCSGPKSPQGPELQRSCRKDSGPGQHPGAPSSVLLPVGPRLLHPCHTPPWWPQAQPGSSGSHARAPDLSWQ